METKKKIWEILAVYNDYTNQTHCSDWHKTILIYDDEEFDIFEEDVEKVKEIIKDLEILEILKKQIREWKIKPTKLWNREKKQINGYQIKALINLNEEQYDKLKEWLNDKQRSVR